MGKLIVDGSLKTTYDDRALAHLQLAILGKLRIAEPFVFTWKDDPSIGGGRTTVWIHAWTNLVFKFDSSQRPLINPAWVRALAFAANAPSGLYLVPEPAEKTLAPVDA